MKKKIQLYVFSLITVITVFIYFLMLFVLRSHYTNEIIDQLLRDAYLATNALNQSEDQDDSIDLMHGIFYGQESTKSRITLIDGTGVVLYESSLDAIEMDNHSTRPEIIKAFRGETSIETRFSNTINKQMVYLAIPFVHDSFNIKVVRTAYPLDSIYVFANRVMRYVIYAYFAFIIIGLIYAQLIWSNLEKPLGKMANIFKRMNKGYLRSEQITMSDTGFDNLCHAFNDMNQSIQKNMQLLASSNHNLSAILSSILTSVIVLDKDQKLVFCNKAAEKFLNIKLEEYKEHHLVEVLRNYEVTKFITDFYNDKTSNVKEIEYQGNILRFNIYLNEGVFNEFKEGVVILVQDMTEIRKLERIRKDFVANVTHELKTPLTSIKGYVELLRETQSLPPNTKDKFLEIIELEADRLSDLISDILLLSEMENSKGQEVEFDACEALTEVVDMMRKISKDKKVHLSYETCHSLMLMGDRNRFKQMMINLIDNGIKYNNPEGNVKVVIEHKSNHLMIQVKDNGIGIETKHLSRLFERFYRADQSRSRQIGGTGLGLAIVKHIVLSFNGEIEVTSQINRGTCFRIKLPINKFKNV